MYFVCFCVFLVSHWWIAVVFSGIYKANGTYVEHTQAQMLYLMCCRLCLLNTSEFDRTRWMLKGEGLHIVSCAWVFGWLKERRIWEKDHLHRRQRKWTLKSFHLNQFMFNQSLKTNEKCLCSLHFHMFKSSQWKWGYCKINKREVPFLISLMKVTVSTVSTSVGISVPPQTCFYW